MKKFNLYITFLLLLFIIPTFAGEPATTRIPVVFMEGANETLNYVLENKENGDIQEIKLKKGENGFFELNYIEPGEYNYIVKQEPGTNKYINYDETIYKIKVIANYDDDNNLHAIPIISIEGKEGKFENCNFINERQAIPDFEISSKPSDNVNGGVQTGESFIYIYYFTTSILILFVGFKLIKKRK